MEMAMWRKHDSLTDEYTFWLMSNPTKEEEEEGGADAKGVDPTKEEEEEGGADAKGDVKDTTKEGDARTRKSRKQKQMKKAKTGGADANPVKDGNVWDCGHYSNQDVSRFNKARVQILSLKNAASCEDCREDSPRKQQGGNKKSGAKNKKKKGGGASGAAEQAKAEKSHFWVCLECRRQFCGGTDSNNPDGHARAHCRKNYHWWAARYDDPSLVYCFKCTVEVLLQFPAFSPSEKKDKTKTSFEQKDKELDWRWSSDSDWGVSSPPSDEMIQELSPPIAREEGKGSSVFVEVSSSQSDPTDEITHLKLSPPVARQDTGISGSAVTNCNVIKGLPNIGNTCFLNVMLQSLLSLDSLRGQMLGPDLWTGPIATSLKQLFVETCTSYDARHLLNPENLFKTICSIWPNFKAGSMEDSGELFVHFLGGLHDEEIEARQLSMDASNNEKVTTIVDSIFRGQECSTLTSTECPHGSLTRQGFLVLPLPIPTAAQLESVRAWRSSRDDDEPHDSDAPISIEDCFTLYTEEELVPEWFCGDCTDAANRNTPERRHVVQTNTGKDGKGEGKEIMAGGGKGRDNHLKEEDKKKVYRAATKTNLITRAPDVLIVTLNRYKQASNGALEKLEGHVCFKEMLDMQPYMDRSKKTDNSTYRLVVVAQHKGNLDGGHYIIYVRAGKMGGQQQQSSGSKSWFYASDDKIRKACMQEVLSCEAYLLVYERCSADTFLSSANVTGEESQLTNTNMWPQTGTPVYAPIPPPLDELESWEYQRNPKRDKRREEELAKKDAIVAKRIWVFLDRFTLSGDNMPYYRFQLATMVERGFGSRELNIPYSHLLSHSKDLAMEVCNGYDRLSVKLTETAREYMQKFVKQGLNVTESGRKLMQQLELKFLEMPKAHEQLKQCLSTNLLREVNVYGHDKEPIMIPLPDKCALVQELIAHVLSKHRAGYSWEGEFDIEDMDVYDGKVVITKSPNLFEIPPQISHELIAGMAKDFCRIETTVLQRFRYSKKYVPYLKPFCKLLSGIGQRSTWWSNRVTTEALWEWIQHFPFLKLSMARANLLSGIHTACRAYDSGDDTALFKKIIERETATSWTEDLAETRNPVLLDVFHYKDPDKDTLYYQEEFEFLFEYMRHLSHHGSQSSFGFRPLASRRDGPRVQLMQSLDELELSGAYRLEFAVVRALTTLIKSSAMKGMLLSVWDCYKRCNSSYQE